MKWLVDNLKINLWDFNRFFITFKVRDRPTKQDKTLSLTWIIINKVTCLKKWTFHRVSGSHTFLILWLDFFLIYDDERNFFYIYLISFLRRDPKILYTHAMHLNLLYLNKHPFCLSVPFKEFLYSIPLVLFLLHILVFLLLFMVALKCVILILFCFKKFLRAKRNEKKNKK